MLGFNGGLMGVRKVPTAGGASGLWSPNEQSVAQRAGIWPVLQETDPYFANVSLLLHMDGNNGSTTFTDSSSNARSVNASGTAAISTSQSKFGSASLLVGAEGVLSPSNVDGKLTVNFTTPWTAECWIYSTTGNGIIFYSNEIHNRVHLTNYRVSFTVDGGVRFNQIDCGFQPNTWHHLALTADSGTQRLFADGVLKATNVQSGGNWIFSTIGAASWQGEPFGGFIDEVRLTRGIARYTATFTSPAAPFPNA